MAALINLVVMRAALEVRAGAEIRRWRKDARLFEQRVDVRLRHEIPPKRFDLLNKMSA